MPTPQHIPVGIQVRQDPDAPLTTEQLARGSLVDQAIKAHCLGACPARWTPDFPRLLLGQNLYQATVDFVIGRYIAFLNMRVEEFCRWDLSYMPPWARSSLLAAGLDGEGIDLFSIHHHTLRQILRLAFASARWMRQSVKIWLRARVVNTRF